MKKTIANSILAGALLFSAACGQRESGTSPKNESAATAVKPAAPATPQPAGPVLNEFKCDLVARNMPKQMSIGAEKVKIEVDVTNNSSAKWFALLPGRSGINSVRLAYRWWRDKEMVMEGGRAELPADLGPGGTAKLSLEISPPKTPGKHTLRIELLQEAVVWFGDAGGCKAEAIVRVLP